MASMWDPPAYAYPDEWADNCRMMPPGSPFPGRWKTSRTPYLRAPMRAFAAPEYDVVVAIMRRQRGKTELGANCLGWMWDSQPGPALWINPTEKLARSFSNDRVEKMFSTIDGLLERTKQSRPGSLEKFIAGIRFGIGWAGSRTETASHPAKYAVIDERSRMPTGIGGEGDPVRIVQAGGGMYPGATSLVISSPTERGLCPTYHWWRQGTKMRWCWRCAGCGEWFVPCLATAKYPDKASYSTIRAEACIQCPECEHEMRDGELETIDADYVPSVEDADGQLSLCPGLEVRNSVASYWVTGLADKITHIGQAMETYARAARGDVLPDDDEADDALQAVVNTTFGELWEVQGHGEPASSVLDRQISDFDDEEIQIVTAGADVQRDSLYYTVRGWCYLSTSYLLENDRILGPTEQPDVWLELARRLEGTFAGRRVAMVLVDSGHATAMVYSQCRRRANWAPAKGHERGDRPYHDSLVDETVTGRAHRGLKLWHHSNDHWKTWLYGRIAWPLGKPGAWYVPAGVDPDYAAQVVNERWRISRGKRIWYRTGDRENHYMDCEILSSVAADIQGVRVLRPPKRADAPETPATPPRRTAHDPMARRAL